MGLLILTAAAIRILHSKMFFLIIGLLFFAFAKAENLQNFAPCDNTDSCFILSHDSTNKDVLLDPIVAIKRAACSIFTIPIFVSSPQIKYIPSSTISCQYKNSEPIKLSSNQKNVEVRYHQVRVLKDEVVTVALNRNILEVISMTHSRYLQMLIASENLSHLQTS
jgi:hypothetical protein